ncbi:MAG: hypothetical protein LBL48_06795 [Azoarcus sp.]|jgi:hypothetical protein|nr:hypothetical protein [Azoarcus sp.]
MMPAANDARIPKSAAEQLRTANEAARQLRAMGVSVERVQLGDAIDQMPVITIRRDASTSIAKLLDGGSPRVWIDLPGARAAHWAVTTFQGVVVTWLEARP